MEKTNNHHLKPRSRRKTNMYDALKERIRKKFVVEPTEADIQNVLFDSVFSTYFGILDGYPDHRNDTVIKNRIITDNPRGWEKVLMELGFYDIDDGHVYYHEAEFMDEIEYYILQNSFSHLGRTQWGHRLLDALVTNIPINIDDIDI